MLTIAAAAARLGRPSADIEAAFAERGLLPPVVITAESYAMLQEQFGPPPEEPPVSIATSQPPAVARCQITAAGFDGDKDVTSAIIARAATRLGISESWLRTCLNAAAAEVTGD